MQLFGHKPNKRSGQNFLVHRAMAERFVDSAATPIDAGATVIEIGPGVGSITQILCERFQRVIAIEKDARLLKLWQQQITKPVNLTLIEGDATNFDYARLHKEVGAKLVVFGNLPFNVSTLILLRLLQNWWCVDYAHLTFQKEVAQRLIAAPGGKDYGSLTIQMQVYADASKCLAIGKGQYFPVPKVDSTVVGLKFLEKPRVPPDELADFEALVRQLFLFRRKTLNNGFRQSGRFAAWAPAALDFLKSQGLKENLRAETLDLATFYRLYRHCKGINR